MCLGTVKIFSREQEHAPEADFTNGLSFIIFWKDIFALIQIAKKWSQ